MLREELRKLHKWEWQKAGYIMRCITELVGKHTGPSGSAVEPRACKYCSYYGHTRQHCEKRLRDEETRAERALLEERAWLEEQEQMRKRRKSTPLVTQAMIFKSLGVPYVIDPYVGAVLTDQQTVL